MEEKCELSHQTPFIKIIIMIGVFFCFAENVFENNEIISIVTLITEKYFSTKQHIRLYLY